MRTVIYFLLMTGTLSAGELVFRAPFEGTADAVVAGGDPACKREAQHFGPGIDGQAVYLGRDALMYQTAQNLPEERGTLTMWVMPIDWTADDGERHGFFSTQIVMDGEQIASQISLHKYQHYPPSARHSNHLVLFTARRQQRGAQFTFQRVGTDGIPIFDWQPGAWHFLALTWNQASGLMQLFIDGHKKLSRRMAIPDHFGPHFFFNGGQRKTDDIALDDLRIYDAALTQGEVRALYLEIIDRHE
ncbi:MAG: hypothetical protein HQ523_09155 [Lentisphaerae bacterium]|nr:hypothetical protein [Lentisphaerota bacterium]